MIKSKACSKVRLMYVNRYGNLFIEYKPITKQSLQELREGQEVIEVLADGSFVRGSVHEIKSSGYVMENWRFE